MSDLAYLASLAKTDCFAFLKRQGGAECKFYAPMKQVCTNCQKKQCDRCLTASYQMQNEK